MIEQFENKIINADCLDILKQLPDKCIDLVLTDPPYGIDYGGQLIKGEEFKFNTNKHGCGTLETTNGTKKDHLKKYSKRF